MVDNEVAQAELARLEALCNEHKRNDWPGIVVPVVILEELVSAYRIAQRVRRQIARALDGHDMEAIRNAIRDLPDDDRPLWKKD